MVKNSPAAAGLFFYLARRPHPAARHTRASCCPPCLCVPQPVIPMHFAARPTGASAAASRFIPSTSVSAQPQQAVPVRPINRRADSYRRPPHPCVPPTAAPVYSAAAKPVYTAAKPPALSRSAVKDTHSIFVLRQESPLHIPFYGKARRSALHPRRKGRRAPPFTLRQESLRPILSTKNAAPNRPARRAGKRV